MGTKLMVLAVVILIILLSVYLFYTSGIFGGFLELMEGGRERIKKALDDKNVETTQALELYYRDKGEENYHKKLIKKAEFTIGRGRNNDLVLDSKTVEKVHAAVMMKRSGDKLYFELVNHGKVNPVRHYDRDTESYPSMAVRGSKSRVILDPAKMKKEFFYIGDYKLIISMPFVGPAPSGTEFKLNQEDQERQKAGNKKRGVVVNASGNIISDSMLDVYGNPEI